MKEGFGKKSVLVTISHCAIATGDVQFMNKKWNDANFLFADHEIIGTIEHTSQLLHI
jgi:D-arabinose 1-dehydrogenase-like Zn-dependent alcohol dehydrogenase